MICLREVRGRRVKGHQPCIYLQMTREALTDTNVPHGVCSVCLCDFLDEGMGFLRTECYHYFHAICMAKYRDHWLEDREESTSVPAYREEIERTQVLSTLSLLATVCHFSNIGHKYSAYI